jgi:hypothetical protein
MQYDRWVVICAMKRETHHLVAVFVHCRSPFLACSSGIKKTTNLPSPLMKQGHGYPCKRNVIRLLSPLQQAGNFLNTVVIYFLDIVFRNLIYSVI